MLHHEKISESGHGDSQPKSINYVTETSRSSSRTAFALSRKPNSIWNKLTVNKILNSSQESGQELIQRGRIVISSNPSFNGRFRRRMSTFSNLPIEARLNDPLAVQELLNSIEGKQENSFRLEPTQGIPNTDKLKAYVQQLVTQELADFSGSYSTYTAKYYVKNLAEVVKQGIKRKIDKRYRIICVSSLGENAGQDLRIKSTYLWDKERDRFFDVNLMLNHENSSVFIVLQVFLIYFN